MLFLALLVYVALYLRRQYLNEGLPAPCELDEWGFCNHVHAKLRGSVATVIDVTVTQGVRVSHE